LNVHSPEIMKALKAWAGGDQSALGQVAEHIYPELRRMAGRCPTNENSGNTLEAAAIINKLYLRLTKATPVEWPARARFFALAAQLLRRILIEAARTRRSHRNGCGARRLHREDALALSPASDCVLFAIDDALTTLAKLAPRQAKVAELRYFGGLRDEEIVAALEISLRTVRRDWDFARAWLSRELGRTVDWLPVSSSGTDI
jgi:RNA polymerase sigma factor (TIGR02999 family)